MSNDITDERILKQLFSVGKLVMDGKRNKEQVAEVLQKIIDESHKFSLVKDLGVIVVTKDYEHTTRLGSFKKENEKKFYNYSNDITDKNFPRPTMILKPGDRLRAMIFEQNISMSTTYDEHMAFLKIQKAVFTGAQGASLVFEQKREDLPKNFRYCSFDEKTNLWKDRDDDCRLSYLRTWLGGGFDFGLGSFKFGYSKFDRFLGFFEEK